MAARSVTVSFTNKSDIALILGDSSLSHGEWTREPPSRIEAGQTVSWESESNGVLTGTEGTAAYDIEGLPSTSRTHWNWDNPYIGSNSYSESAPETFRASRSGGDGDNANVTWIFDDASLTGDGIPDDWKIHGVTIDSGDGSGPQFIDLPAMGADVNKPDIFVQVDWMADATHSHALSPAVIKTVVDAFANSPFVSRSGSIGINLHVDAGPASTMNFATGQTWGALSRARQIAEVPQFGTGTVDSSGNVTSYNWKEFDEVKNQLGGFTSSGRTKIFRYCISAHQLTTGNNSGQARAIPGSDFLVTLGTFTGLNDTSVAGTFMHELGHCLGLDHGGGDGVNNKPNYVSIMNYLWQFPGLTRAGVANIVDYSNAALNPMDETSLNETAGLGRAAAGVAIQHFVPATAIAPAAFVQVADGSLPIDWNGDGNTTETNVPFDTNNDGTLGTLSPYDDWKNLKLRGGAIGAGGSYVPPDDSTVVEITPAQLRLILPADNTPPQTTVAVWPAPNAAGWNRTSVELSFTATDDISGVARTEYAIDGAVPATVSGPVAITAEGEHRVAYHSVDRSQNVEGSRLLDVRIDKTAPEAVITYDPLSNEIVVTGRDELSGVEVSPVPASHVTPTTWSDFGSDVAELRVYRITDRANNATTLAMKVRCSPVAFEASVLAISYDDEIHRDRLRETHDRSSEKDVMQKGVRNTIVFERLVGRGSQQPLLGVRQAVSIGERGGRTTVKARYDVLDDLTLLTHETGSTCCAEREKKQAALEADIRGLVLLHVVSHDGLLVVEE